MRFQPRPVGFRSAAAALLRTAAHVRRDLPPWPDLTDSAPNRVGVWVDWLRDVWAIEDVAEAIEHASPVLARQVRVLCEAEEPAVRETRRAVMSVARYAQRMVGRSTPFGLLAGVSPAFFGTRARHSWGSEHQAIVRAGAEWLAAVVARLEEYPELLARLSVVANDTVMVRGGRLIVPYQPRAHERGMGAVEVSLRYTPAVRAAVDAARAPIRIKDLATKLQPELPTATPTKITAMLRELVARRVLITCLHPPSTEPDALGHVVERLTALHASTVAPVSDLVAALNEIYTLLEQHNRTPAEAGRGARAAMAARMHGLVRTRTHPLAVDLRLDAATRFPDKVAREIERAALTLTRLSAYPVGAPAWRSYHQRFYERYGIGSLVPLLDVISDSGVGWPDGYPGTVTPERRSPLSRRDERLLALAQGAALEGRTEVVLDEPLIAALDLGPQQLRPPPHLELGVRVLAADQTALDGGDFTVEVTSVSRAAGVLTGRFLSILAPHDRAALAAGLADLPSSDGDTVTAQLSFPPLDPATAHVTRTVQILPMVISLAEHRGTGERVLTAEDLAVGCDGRRMYLAAPRYGLRLETAGAHALNLRTHTPPLARFLTELSRAQYAQVTMFDWGAAAHLPFLPRLRHGRTILSAARWRLEAFELPDRSAPWTTWNDALTRWQSKRQLPRTVRLADADRLLPLDLDQTGHRMLLRAHLDNTSHAVLSEDPAPEEANWCGGRPHELIVPLTVTEPTAWPPVPKPTPARIISRGRSESPATANMLLASLYGDLHRQDVILTEHLPELLSRLDGQMLTWWFVRYRDPDHHLRLRIALPDPAAFGEAAATVSTWADELHHIGLLRAVTYPTSFPETGRWGSGPAWTSAQEVFTTDSQAVLVQLCLPVRPHRHALMAANSVSIATTFTGSVDAGMRWLIDHVPARAPARVPRPVYSEAVRVADPSDDWARLRAAPGGAAVADSWGPRDRALAAYRTHLPGPNTEGIAIDDVLTSLLHVNFVRACGIDFDDEAVGLYLARAAALSWTARTNSGPR